MQLSNKVADEHFFLVKQPTIIIFFLASNMQGWHPKHTWHMKVHLLHNLLGPMFLIDSLEDSL